MQRSIKLSKRPHLREEEHKLEMWDQCIGYLYSDIMRRLSYEVFKLMDIMITDENFRASIANLLVSSHHLQKEME